VRLVERYPVPTGDILVVQGSMGQLECLSLADYGKDVNLAEMAVPDDVQPLPLSEKWVATISSQYGCSMGCNFCDVPVVGPGLNASSSDLLGQLEEIIDLHPNETTKRFNVHFARMGEPTFNFNVITVAAHLAGQRELARTIPNWEPPEVVHPVVSTMMPKGNRRLDAFLRIWTENIKNDMYEGEAGLQLSINSTDAVEREEMFNGMALPLEEIAHTMMRMPYPLGRKYTLNFAVADYTVDENILADFFSPERFICKLTPMHKTRAALANDVKTAGDYTAPEPYEDLAARLRRVGFDVLVFIASRDEDESRITCGNAILSGTEPMDLR